MVASLWLHPPDAQLLDAAGRDAALAPHLADPAALAVAHADLLLLNVYPYAGVYLEPGGELNGLRAQELSAAYERDGYAPAELTEVAAADHAGLLLGYLQHLAGVGGHEAAATAAARYALDWLPLFCLAVEREPGAHPLYRALAAQTRAALFALARPDLAAAQFSYGESASAAGDDPAAWLAEVGLSAVVHFLLCPAQSGLFLSRGRLGRWAVELGTPVPFAGRFQVGRALFEAAGLAQRLPDLLAWLAAEARAWDAAFMAWGAAVPAWAPFAAAWRARLGPTLRLLAAMQDAAACPPPAQ